MSLNWHHKKFASNDENTVMIEDDPNHPGHKRIKVKSETLIFSTMFVQIGEITEKNVDEFWRRLNLWQHGIRHLLSDDNGPVYFTRDDIVEHIGLTTNVYPSWPAKRWDAEFKTRLMEEVEQKARRAASPRVKLTAP